MEKLEIQGVEWYSNWISRGVDAASRMYFTLCEFAPILIQKYEKYEPVFLIWEIGYNRRISIFGCWNKMNYTNNISKRGW